MYYVETRADNSGYTNHRVICLVIRLFRIISTICWQEKTTPSSILFELFPLFDLEFLQKYNFSIIMIGIEMKLNMPVEKF
jgi:hypothetical protein